VPLRARQTLHETGDPETAPAECALLFAAAKAGIALAWSRELELRARALAVADAALPRDSVVTAWLLHELLTT
jgi:hypothetical protein